MINPVSDVFLSKVGTDTHHDGVSDHTAVNVAARLKMVREQNGLSQRELAKRAGVTHSNISMIEQGQNSPSISSLEKILSGIPMTITQFFLCDPRNMAQVVYRASELVGHQQQHDGIIFQAIPHKSPYADISLTKIILAAGSDIGAIPQITRHAVSGYVLTGQLELTANTHVSLLQPGDAFSLPAQQPHRLRNISPVGECVLLVCKA